MEKRRSKKFGLMKNFELFMALRYIKPKRSFISILTFLSVLGPALGVAVLIVVIAVMSGFDIEIKERILNMQAHFNVSRFRGVVSEPEKVIAEIKHALPSVEASAVSEGPILLQTRNGVNPEMLIGIVPDQEEKVTKISEAIAEGSYQLNDNDVLVGRTMARKYGLRIGSKVIIHSLEKLGRNINFEGSTPKMAESPVFSLPKELVVTGIFELGVHEYDSSILFTNLDTAAEVFGLDWGSATRIKVKTKDPFKLTYEENILRGLLQDYDVTSWMQANRTLFGALKMEKNMMFFLLFFIVLVAAFGIAGTLLTFAMQKNREMAVLKALGSTPGQVMRIFLWLGLMIGSVATTLGTILGMTIVHFRNEVAQFLSMLKGSEVFPPELYHLTKIPGALNTNDLLIIYIGSLMLCVIAAMLPAMFAAWTNPAMALKSEETL
ncbi:MAG: ABC transporter permease [Lentisphaeria bacterium]